MRPSRIAGRLRARHPKSDSTLEEAGLVQGCEEFLQGQLLEEFSGRVGHAPGWVWINVVAHASEAGLASYSGRGHDVTASQDSWERTTSRVASMLLDDSARTAAPLEQLQREVVIPIELGLVDRRISPSEFAREVKSGLESHRRVA